MVLGWAQAGRSVGSSEQTARHVARIWITPAFASVEPEEFASTVKGGSGMNRKEKEGSDCVVAVWGQRQLWHLFGLQLRAYIMCVWVSGV